MERLHRMLILRDRNQELIIDDEIRPTKNKNVRITLWENKKTSRDNKRTERGRRLQRTREKRERTHKEKQYEMK